MAPGYYIQVIFTLLLLGVVLYFMIRFSHKLQSKRYSGDIKLIDRRPIDQHSTLFIVEVRGHHYFISLGGKDVKVIEKLS